MQQSGAVGDGGREAVVVAIRCRGGGDFGSILVFADSGSIVFYEFCGF